MGIFKEIYESILNFLSILRISDLIDVSLVAYIIYKGIKLVRETRAQQLVKGIIILVILTLVSDWLHLGTINYILRNTMQFAAIALLVVFQPELRRALEKVGRSHVLSFLFPSSAETENTVTSEITKTAAALSATHTGALIVIERDTKLGEIIKTGTELDANVSSELLGNIFVPNTPLHDGAVVIRDDKIKAAACLLPLTENNSLSRELGTRHRAALGVSEMSDAIVVVVSEETGKISLVYDGNMQRGLSKESLEKAISNIIDKEKDIKTSKLNQWKEHFKWKN